MCNNCEPQSIDCYYLLLGFWVSSPDLDQAERDVKLTEY